MAEFDLSNVHPSWLPLLQTSLSTLDPAYLAELKASETWLPGHQQIFNAFSLPLHKTQYILFGESPYPRKASAIGYAFWDGAAEEIWSEKGLSKPVNRATSLRNIVKMLLVCQNSLSLENTSQSAIAALDKTNYIESVPDLFINMQKQGILLLNATLVLTNKKVAFDAKAWRPFMAKLLEGLASERKDICLILLGKVANLIDALPQSDTFNKFYAEHPYNLSFIANPAVKEFFQPFDLLKKLG